MKQNETRLTMTKELTHTSTHTISKSKKKKKQINDIKWNGMLVRVIKPNFFLFLSLHQLHPFILLIVLTDSRKTLILFIALKYISFFLLSLSLYVSMETFSMSRMKAFRWYFRIIIWFTFFSFIFFFCNVNKEE